MKFLENTLTNWSYKKYKMYNACPYSVYLMYILRVPQPPQDPKYDAKRLRGIQAHDDLQDTINDGAPIPPIAKDFTEIIEGYIELNAVAEGDEYFDNSWNKMTPTFSASGFPSGHWLVVKKDIKIVTPDFALVGDWKTGKKYGNELDHFTQMKLYAVTEWRLNPGLPEYIVELQYLDQKDSWTHTFKPQELEKHWVEFDKNVSIMFNDHTFRPKPNKLTCQYCPFNHKGGTGACAVAAV